MSMAQADSRYLVIPQGLLHGKAARLAVARGKAIPLAGERMAFMSAWLAHRCVKTGEVSRRFLTAAQLRAQAEGEPALAEVLARVSRPRAPFAGLDLSRPRVMGIVNVTPDSFSDGGRYLKARAAIDHARRLAEAGADVLDVGGESTRPGARAVSVQEELDRVMPVIEALAADGLVVSVDTRKSAVMREAVRAGAKIVNDVSALSFDPRARATVARLGVPVILMHMRGTPDTMMEQAEYDDVLWQVHDKLAAAVRAARQAGIAERNIMIDPGIGFAKRTAHNVTLTRHLAALHGLGLALLYAASRKRFIGEITGEPDAAARLGGSLAVAQMALMHGAHMVRVHDVAETAQMARLLSACLWPEDEV